MTLTLPRSAASLAAELSAAQAAAVQHVNDRIGQARLAYITAQPAQDAIYTAKEAEALRYQADPAPPADLAGYPFLAAEAGTTAPDAPALAALWVQMADQWRSAAAALEGLRLGAIAQIEAATSPAGVATARAAFDAALEA